ncbi:MAG: hypothetical protein M3Y40_04345 [Chloroflexota bacterium]|nr:hypothetical protein [Chloroflexota bacterium]
MVIARGREGYSDLTTLPLHPILAAAYPVIFLFAINSEEQVGTAHLWLPLLLSVGITTGVLVVLRLVVGDWRRAGLMTTVLVVAFFGYGHAWNAVSQFIDNQWLLIIAWILALILALELAWSSRRFTVPWTRGLNFVAAVLVGLNGWSVASSMVAIGAVTPPTTELTELELAPPDDGELPDVYYIILDRYGGPTALRETYDFDNEPFLTALEDRGFAVARHAHANYIKTPLSLVSSLNMEMLDTDALNEAADSGRDRNPIQRMLSERLVVPTALKELGYSYIQVANWWTPTQRNVDADRVFLYEGQDEFSSVLAQTTLLRALGDPNSAPDDPWDWEVMRENNLYALDRLDEIPDLPGPKYVFAHLVTTHPPYVHNADGSFTGRAQVAELGDIESYRRQLTYANSRMLSLMDRIIASDPNAVIMLQADEGPFPERYRELGWDFDWREATDAELEEKFGILFAMRVPGADVEAEGFHDAITPVNAFRVIFNARFGTDLPLLPDVTLSHTDLYHFYDMFDITDRLRR